jgi:hypothetical protein
VSCHDIVFSFEIKRAHLSTRLQNFVLLGIERRYNGQRRVKETSSEPALSQEHRENSGIRGYTTVSQFTAYQDFKNHNSIKEHMLVIILYAFLKKNIEMAFFKVKSVVIGN